MTEIRFKQIAADGNSELYGLTEEGIVYWYGGRGWRKLQTTEEEIDYSGEVPRKKQYDDEDDDDASDYEQEEEGGNA